MTGRGVTRTLEHAVAADGPVDQHAYDDNRNQGVVQCPLKPRLEEIAHYVVDRSIHAEPLYQKGVPPKRVIMLILLYTSHARVTWSSR
jgi:hypothetical protein